MTIKQLRVPIYLQTETNLCLRKYLALANQYLNTNYPEPTIVFRNKGSVAGAAYLTQWKIQLNSHLLIENGQPFIAEVVPHELAHLLVFKQYGKEWQWMMSDVLSRPPMRTHNFTSEQIKKNYHTYYCHCQTHQLSTIRHNKIVRNQLNYTCTKCHVTLSPKPLIP